MLTQKDLDQVQAVRDLANRRGIPIRAARIIHEHRLLDGGRLTEDQLRGMQNVGKHTIADLRRIVPSAIA